ncbi:TDT family transporter [Pedococcus sp. KACC 23699]|uniref:TDT family transporter n=1 Tax=Pedococcus sp. KACC 23699 TaxID=3149228 RepID=A0AAU7JXH8_9MICO
MTASQATAPYRTAAPSTPTTSLPPAGPAWFASVMGTGILATLLGREASGTAVLLVPATALLAVGAVLLIGLSAGFAARVAADRAAFTATLRDLSVLPTWGTVSMGILSIGSAALTVLPQLGARTGAGAPASWVVGFDAGCWVVGTALGVVTALGFATVVLGRDLGRPLPAWGLPVVPPMVSATTGAALAPQLHTPAAQLTLLTTTVACFFLSLFLGGLVFAASYHHHWRVAPLPASASASSWIPLGVVGQSMAAAQVIAAQSAPLLSPTTAAAARTLADTYGYVMLALSLPVAAYAVSTTVRGFRAGMGFSPGWWALTFPLGTLALGTRLLGSTTGHAAISTIGLAAIVTLCGTWLLCATTSVRAVAAAAALTN